MDQSTQGNDHRTGEAVEIIHEPCPSCGSSDNLARWPDGHAHCFTPKCGHHENSDGSVESFPDSPEGLIQVEYERLTARKVSERTCRYYNYGVAHYKGHPVQVAQYRDKMGKIVAQKLRFADKKFAWLGDKKKALPLFGQHLQGGGKMIVITEGEIDALSMAEVEKCSWPVVSLPDGAGSAKKSIAQSLEFLNRFERIILMFDNDDAGRAATEEAAMLLPPGRVCIAQLSHKDPNEVLLAGEGHRLVREKWNAAPYRPDGVVMGSDMLSTILKPLTMSEALYPWEDMNKTFYGLRPREIVSLCGGTGSGKSSVARELAYNLMRSGYKVGYFALEESIQRTGLGFVGLELNQPVHLAHLKATPKQLTDGFDRILKPGNLVMYDHFGSLDPDTLLAQMRYMRNGCDVDYIFFDHLSILISGSTEKDERRLIDRTMTSLRSFTEETEVGMVLVSHLARPKGTPHEEGGVTSLAQLRGSHAIGQLSDIVIGCERDQQSERHKNVLLFRSLKDRYTGSTGIAGYAEYSPETGRIVGLNRRAIEAELAQQTAADLGFATTPGGQF